MDELTVGRFLRVIPDPFVNPPVSRVLLCSGKIYFDLAEHRRELGRDDVAIVRVEQLAPLPYEHLKTVLAGYPDGTPVCWVQEEPENMGAWRYLRASLGERLFDRLPFTGIARRPLPVQRRALRVPTNASRRNWSSRPSGAFDGEPRTA